VLGPRKGLKGTKSFEKEMKVKHPKKETENACCKKRGKKWGVADR
jgi:hypothetical protein